MSATTDLELSSDEIIEIVERESQKRWGCSYAEIPDDAYCEAFDLRALMGLPTRKASEQLLDAVASDPVLMAKFRQMVKDAAETESVRAESKCLNCGEVDVLVLCPCGETPCRIGGKCCPSCARAVKKNIARNALPSESLQGRTR